MTTLKCVEIDYYRVMHVSSLKYEGAQATIVARALIDKTCM